MIIWRTWYDKEWMPKYKYKGLFLFWIIPIYINRDKIHYYIG